MSSQRPVYIPRRRKAAAASNGNNANNNNNPVESAGKRPFQKRQKQLQPRFHGAFTGGFSAGHFNTVGTKEGWTPSQNKIRDQKLEDFMDEEDHADWGGPTRLREAYEHKVGTTASNPSDVDADADRNVDGDGDGNGPNSGGTIHKNPIGSFLPLQSMLEISHQTVGPRLLRRLGWREGGTAIVPENTTRAGTQSSAKENDDGDLARVHLSKRRLRKIQLQSSRITKLPPPKLDQCGLGFEPYKDAPEFQRYREQRRQQAKDRASYDTSTKGRNVYRLSDVASGSETTAGAGAANANANANADAATANASRSKSRDAATTGNSDYLSFETAEDFVGKRSAAGFALRDDEDDAYDNERPRNNRRGGSIEVGEEYNTEVYEHVDSDDDDDNDNDNDAHDASSALPAHRAGGGSHSRGVTNQRAVRAGDVFAAWAGTDPHSSKGTQASASNASRSMPATKTLDGKIPLAGFVVGDSVDTSQKRYAGPDIPRNYAIQRHEFGEHENPYVLEAISNAVRLEQTEERNFRARQQQQQQLQQESQRQLQGQSAKPDRPLTKNFSSLADAMKSRFTPAAPEPELSKQQGGSAHTEQTSSFPAGLHLPNPVQTKTGSSESAGPPLPPSHTPEIAIQRTVRSFVPNPLVCKRFRVPVPSHARASSALASAKSANNNNNNNNTMKHNKSRESVYFEREILQKAKEEFQTKNRPELAVAKDPEANASTTQESSGDDGEEDRKGLDRPSIERLRSIFEASSDESSSSDDEDEDGMEEEGEGEGKGKNENENDSSRSAKGDTNSSENASTEKANESSRAIVEYQHASLSSPSSSLARKGENRDGSLSTSSRDDNDNYDDDADADDDSSSRGRRRRREKRRRKHDRHRRKQKRKRSRSTDRDRDRDRDRDYHCCSSDDDEDEKDDKDYKRGKEKERRRKRDKRTKKKKSSWHSSSSRHRSRKREKTQER